MLILSNGNYKSGSTWVTQILSKIIETEAIEVQYCDRKYKNRIQLDQIESFFLKQYLADKHYISKTHYFLPKEIKKIRGLAKKYPILIIGSDRNIGDALISHFHHLVRDNKINDDITAYSKRIGFYKRLQMEYYNQRWRHCEENEIIISFESLKYEFKNTLHRLQEYLKNFDVSTKDLDESEVTIDILRKKAEGDLLDEKREFFRSGKTGEFEQITKDNGGEKIRRNIFRKANYWDKVIYWLIMEKRIQLKRWAAGASNNLVFQLSKIL